MKILIGLLMISLLPVASSGQDSIEFFPKELGRELKKTCKTDLLDYSELYIPESVQPTSGINGKYFKMSGNECSIMFFYTGRVYSCRADGCNVTNSTIDQANSEYFDYFMFFDSRAMVTSVRVYNYQASHGHEITARGWLNQFTRYDGSKKLEVGKDIDAISGATVSAVGIAEDIQAKSELLRKLYKPEL